MHGTTFAFPGVDYTFKALGVKLESRNVPNSGATATPHVDPTPTLIPTVKVVEETPIPVVVQRSTLAAPISPFPWDVRQQVGVLQAHDRFFFSGNPDRQEIALTFDDGPDPPYTSEILAILKQYNVKASFFCVGHHVAEHPELVKQELDEGHTVAIHSWDHIHLPNYSAATVQQQMDDTAAILKKTTGVQPAFFRPPFGSYNTIVLAHANKMGLTTFLWNDVASDWLQPGASVISSRVINAARSGSIVLLHDGDGDHYNAIASREQTVQALPTIITTLQARGYRFVTLDQMMNNLHK
ncbi:MAG: hypothetical protein NVS2B12_34190 [Ktedonobacteraceae bacterium]